MDELRSAIKFEKKQKEAIMSTLSNLIADVQVMRAANDAYREAALALSAKNAATAW